ncbi:MAG: hypothetical protein HYX92_03660 [Chloroflexi bacterium]|nr:hypothetical protein [Chloroflexota bacterium]
MADLAPRTGPNSDTGDELSHEPTTGTPRWVKVFAVAALALLVLFVILHLTGNSPGGPGRHIPLIERGAPQP